MLHALVRFPGHVKNREQLMGEAEMVVDDGTITSHVKRIRRKFEALDASFNAIETVYGMGYRWTEG
jgi:two-component system OmpR family response regulator